MEELMSAARKLELEVRIEPFITPGRSAGGLCRIRGRQVVLLDARAAPLEQAASLAEALVAFELEAVYMAPEARRFIEQRRQPSAWRPQPEAPRDAERNVLPLARSKPGLRSTKPDRER